jgi:hypothetical protein
MDQSFVAAIYAATFYKPLVDPLQLALARLYNHIQSGLTLPPDCLLSCILACTSIIMVFTTIIITKRVQYQLSRQHVTAKKFPEQPTGKPNKMIFYRTRRKGLTQQAKILHVHSTINADNNVSNI